MSFRKFWSRILENTVPLLVAGILGWLGKIAYDILLEIGSPLLKTTIEFASKTLLLKTILGLVVILIALIVWVFFLYKIVKDKNKLKLLCGVLWDADSNPHCPNCKNVLVNYSNAPANNIGPAQYHLPARSTFECLTCKKPVELKNIHGAVVPLSLVLEDLKKQTI